nr:hypothetical protein [Tanacetum cinerariifolium]
THHQHLVGVCHSRPTPPSPRNSPPPLPPPSPRHSPPPPPPPSHTSTRALIGSPPRSPPLTIILFLNPLNDNSFTSFFNPLKSSSRDQTERSRDRAEPRPSGAETERSRDRDDFVQPTAKATKFVHHFSQTLELGNSLYIDSYESWRQSA